MVDFHLKKKDEHALWMNEAATVIVATNALNGNKANVKTVIHIQLQKI
jgi:superfamily II DNA helicase RecQ